LNPRGFFAMQLMVASTAVATRLVEPSTPYLRAGAAQPVDWWPFGDAALDEARARGRPLLVVVGTGFSFACRRLDAEAFEDEALARAIAARFVAVRVDAEARPDVDERLQALAGGWGRPSWPLVAVLAPDGEPCAVRAHLGRVGVRALVEEPDFSVRQFAAPAAPLGGTRASLVAAALDGIRAAYDAAAGGFELPPKLPRAPLVTLLLASPDPSLHAMARRTLDAMAHGGLHDQLGGGFHRASTDERWVVPRFEKRAADQAALLALYALAAERLSEPRFAEVARGIAGYVAQRLAAPGGGFYAAEDAHLGPYDEGSYYTWTVDEARAALDADELAVAQPAFDLYGRGEMLLDPTRNVLFRAAAPSEIAHELGRDESEVHALVERARTKLLAARETRPRPDVDPTIYVGASAAMARALLRAAPLVDGAEARALETLDRLYAAVGPDGSVPHRLVPAGAPDPHAPPFWPGDAVELARAAVAAFHATGAPLHRERMRQMAAALAARLQPDEVSILDDAGPSAAAGAVRLFRDVAALDGDPAWAGRAEALLEARLGAAAAAPVACAALVGVAAASF
jgi:uncharacterized protein YyaL (SSP411 family)